MTNLEKIFKLTQKLGWRITTAESCTAGMISSELTAIPGSSSFYDRGFITYSNDAKIDMLNVKETTLRSFGAVSEQVAIEMAIGSLENSIANLTLSITGIAGPGGSEHKEEGTVCFGLAIKNGSISSCTKYFGAIGRDNVRKKATDHAIKLILQKLNEHA